MQQRPYATATEFLFSLALSKRDNYKRLSKTQSRDAWATTNDAAYTPKETTHIPPSTLHLSRESCWFDKQDINIITKDGSSLKFMTSTHNSPSPLARAKIELLVLCQGNLHKRDPLPDDVSGCCNIYKQIYSPNKWGSFR